MIESISATAAGRIGAPAPGGAPFVRNVGPSGGEGFADMVRDASTRAISEIRAGDAAAIRGVTGQAGAQEVVQAVLAMETTVRTVTSIRDKAVEAYQEILRMPV
jgi:flagellar hook-basal body complex protein FliE